MCAVCGVCVCVCVLDALEWFFPLVGVPVCRHYRVCLCGVVVWGSGVRGDDAGQNDVILSAPNCEHFLQNLAWNTSAQWHAAPRVVWKVSESDDQPAGYVRQGGGLTYVVVRDAGHLLPQDQPVRAFDMLSRWIKQQPYGDRK